MLPLDIVSVDLLATPGPVRLMKSFQEIHMRMGVYMTSSAPCFGHLGLFFCSLIIFCLLATVSRSQSHKVAQILQVSRYKKTSLQHLFTMRSLILLSLAPLALANDVFKRAVLQPRQGSDAYKPIGIPDPICQYPCGTDWCVHPEEGDICCAEGCE